MASKPPSPNTLAAQRYRARKKAGLPNLPLSQTKNAKSLRAFYKRKRKGIMGPRLLKRALRDL